MLRLYPPETVIAEKFQAMVELGLGNSRLKDFYDVWILARHFEFDGAVLARAMGATFARRQTPLPVAIPESLSDEFCGSGTRITQWRAFTRKGRLQNVPALVEVVGVLRSFLWPPVEALRAGLP